MRIAVPKENTPGETRVAIVADTVKRMVAKKIDVRRPGRNLKFSLAAAGLRAITSLLQHSLDMTGTSIREFIRIWEAMEGKHEVGMTSLGNYIQQWRCNEFVRDALYSRFYTLSNSGIFYDGKAGDPDTRDDDAIEAFFEGHPDGGALIVSLTRTSPLNRRMTVELILSPGLPTVSSSSFTPNLAIFDAVLEGIQSFLGL